MDCFALVLILGRAAGVSTADHMHGVSLMQKVVITRTKSEDSDYEERWVAREEEDADAPPPYVLTWEVPAALRAPQGVSVLEAQRKRWINVTALEARRMTGPLTLLLALRLCEGAKTIKPILEKARQRGQAHIHVLGVQDNLEPWMAWKQFLVGPLSTRDRLLVDFFGLPRTPLAGVNVSLLFNGDELSSHAPGDSGTFTERRTSGVYHKRVKDVPDLVVALNPGFPFYLGNWWPTLRRLWHLHVPIVATGYGHNMRNGFAIPALYNLGYDAEDDSAVQRKVTASLQSNVSIAQTMELPPANITCAESKDFVGLPENNATVCSDREGNALVADHAGFDVLAAVRNPFVFCNSPSTHETTTNCQGSEVLSMLQPRAGGADALALSSEEEEMPPSALAYRIMHRTLTCYSYYTQNRACIERRLQRRSRKRLPRNARLRVQDYLAKLADACEDERY